MDLVMILRGTSSQLLVLDMLVNKASKDWSALPIGEMVAVSKLPTNSSKENIETT
jgi:hypothetical protein